MSPAHHAPVLRPFLGPLQLASFRLDNGLRIHVVPDRTVPVVAWQIWYRVGSASEEEGRSGLAHLFEHMMFKATEDYGEGEFSAILDGLGADGLNAWTWLDETVYTVAVPVGALDTVARLEASRMRRLRLVEDSFQRERDVVLNERKFRVDNDPGGRMSEALYAAAFQAHPYRRPTIGWADDVARLTLADCRAFYDRWYAPDQATVVLVGDVDPEEAAALVERHFGSIPASGGAEILPPADPPPAGPREERLRLPMATDRALVAWRVPGRGHPATPALVVLDSVLTAGRGSLLSRALVDGGQAGSVSAMLPPLVHEGLYEVDAVCRPGVPADELRDAVQAVVDRLAAEGPEPGDLERGIRQVRAALLHSLVTTTGKADFLGIHERAAGGWEAGVRLLAEVGRVTAAEVAEAAARWLGRDRRTTVLGHADEEPGAREPAPPPVPREPVGPRPPERPVGPPPALPRGLVRDAQVAGVPVVTAHDPTLPLVGFRLLFPFGSAADPRGQEGLAALTTRMTLKGTRDRSRRDFEDTLERLGATVAFSLGADLASLSATMPAEAWSAFVALATEALARPAFRREDLDHQRDRMLDGIRDLRDGDRELAVAAFQEELFGREHPYGTGSQGTETGLGACAGVDLEGFRRRYLVRGGALAALHGAFDDRALDDLAGLLEVLPGDACAAPPVHVTDLPEGRRIVVVDKPGRTQTQVVGGLPNLAWADPDHAAMRLGNEVFGGGTFSARLMDQVRERRGWSYGAYSWDSPRRYRGAWQWWIMPSVEDAPAAIELVLDMIQDLAREGVTAEELEQARRIVVNGAPFLVDTVEKRVGLEVDRRLTGWDALAEVEAMKRLPLGAVNEVLARRVRSAPHVVVVVGPADPLVETLAHLGEVEVRPWTTVARGGPRGA